jgi:hypothetical protein
MEGVASVGARITFSDGSAREARPRIVRVVAPAAPLAGQLVTEGRLTIPPLAPGSAAWHGWVPFTTWAAGRVSVRVDWELPLNRMDCSGYDGHCDAIGKCGMIRMTCNTIKDKPITASFDSPATPAGPYTIRIDNLGPGEEAVRYEVRLTPR